MAEIHLFGKTERLDNYLLRRGFARENGGNIQFYLMVRERRTERVVEIPLDDETNNLDLPRIANLRRDEILNKFKKYRT